MTEQTIAPAAASSATTDDRRPAPEADGPSVVPRFSRRHRTDLLALLGILVVLAFVWGRARHEWFWIDEGIAAGISSHPLHAIPDLLRQDGSPPLYYALLHVWMSAFGSSEATTHLLSLVFALAVIPAALWAGWSLFDRRTGWLCAALAAVSPFLGHYATETRMYSLVVLLALLATATFLHAFVFGRRRYAPAFAVVLALLLYTHNWGLFFGLGAGLALLVCVAFADDRRSVLLTGVLAFAGAGLLYAPWLPNLLYQRAHTGAQFAQRPTLVQVRDDLFGILGSKEAVVALALGAGAALVALVRPPWDRPGAAAVATGVIIGVAIAGGWMISRDQSVWVARYLAVVIGPIYLVLAAALGRGGRPALVGLAVYALFVVPLGVKGPPYQKSNVALIAAAMRPRLQPGDLVLTDFGRTPVLAYYLPPGLRYAETTGPVPDARVSDQRDGAARLRQLEPRTTVTPLLEALPPGGHALVVCPPVTARTETDTVFVILAQQRCDEMRHLVGNDPRFREDLTVVSPLGVTSPADGHLFTKLAP